MDQWSNSAAGLWSTGSNWSSNRPPDSTFTEKRGHKTYQIQVWDTDGLPFMADYPQPVRVVRSEEVLERNRFREGQRSSFSTDHEWLWITTLDPRSFPAATIRQLGHSRWKQENNGWMDLTKHWAFKHGFLHACQHRPQQINVSGRPQPVPNRGLEAVTFVLLIAFALSSAFVLRHSKLARREHFTALAVAGQLHASISKAPPVIRAPD